MSWTRREFGRLGAMAAGAAVVGGSAGWAQGAAGGKTIGYAVVGLGRISNDHFLPGLKTAKRARATALVSGHRDKALKMAAQYGIPESSVYSYEDYDKIRENPAVDAVYIGLPNSMHCEYTVRAAKAGKHVLCEKPMAVSVAESQQMIDACNAAGKKLMIAYRCQYQPQHLKAIEMIRSGAIGKVQMIQSSNGFNIQPGEWRLSRTLGGGGPLVDVGIYSLNACRYLTGEEPVKIEAATYTDKSDPRFGEVEENLTWNMRFPSGILASCQTSYGANLDGFVRVYGSKGILEMHPAFNYQGIQLHAQLPGHQMMDDAETQTDPAQFTAQADYFAGCVLDGTPVKSDGAEGKRDMQWMSEIYKTAGLPYLQA
jgi:predicted dehydrogenase